MKLPNIATAIFALILLIPGFAMAQNTSVLDLGTDFTTPNRNPVIDADEEVPLGDGDEHEVLEVICTNENDQVTILFHDSDRVRISVSRVGEDRIRRQRNFDVEDFSVIAINTFGGNDIVTVEMDDTYSPELLMELMYTGFGIYVELGDGNDQFDNWASPFTSLGIGGRGADTLKGGAGIDYLTGNVASAFFGSFDSEGDGDIDTIFGNGGHDELEGEYVIGGEGSDYIYSSETLPVHGHFTLIAAGGPGNDVIFGTTGADFMFGGGDNDEISGAGGADFISGGNGDDELDSIEENENVLIVGASLYGGDGNDILQGGSGDDYLNGGNGNDDLFGGSGSDRLFGGNGQDLLCGSSLMARDGYVDHLQGGQHEDTFVTWYSAQYNLLKGQTTNHEEEPVDLEKTDTWIRTQFFPVPNFGW